VVCSPTLHEEDDMKRPDYGLDAPGVIIGAIGVGGAVVALAASLNSRFLCVLGTLIVSAGVITFASSRYGKLLLRDRLLDGLGLRGDERVLDVGCGRGLLLVGAAKRLSTGRAAGLDLWVQADQLHNGKDAALENAELEGVAARVEIHDGDMRAMPFEDGSVDVVVSNLAIHNVPTVAGRRKALSEIARVLRPGGRVALMDLAFTSDYARWLAEEGLTTRRTWPAPWFFPPVGVVVAKKPPSARGGSG
jgi:ubiquinone/menaquinone biosynthesis C-methylase UbiE